jgi:hypothetical protein
MFYAMSYGIKILYINQPWYHGSTQQWIDIDQTKRQEIVKDIDVKKTKIAEKRRRSLLQSRKLSSSKNIALNSNSNSNSDSSMFFNKVNPA